MKKLIAILLIFFAAFNLFQVYIKKVMDNAAFQVAPSHKLPSSIGLEYKEIILTHDNRTVRAWFVKARNVKERNTAVILFNGIGGNLSGWIYFQQFLADRGISSVSFEYGPQQDTLEDMGSSRLPEVTNNINAIIDSLHQQNGNNLRLFLLGHSVGNAVMLEMYPDIDTTSITGIIICNAFSSMKEWGLEHGKIPRIFAFVFPDYFDNVANIKKVTKPVLIVHSKADKTNFFSGASEIFNAANLNKQFVQFDNYKHNDIFNDSNFDYWTPIVKFIEAQP